MSPHQRAALGATPGKSGGGQPSRASIGGVRASVTRLAEGLSPKVPVQPGNEHCLVVYIYRARAKVFQVRKELGLDKSQASVRSGEETSSQRASSTATTSALAYSGRLYRRARLCTAWQSCRRVSIASRSWSWRARTRLSPPWLTIAEAEKRLSLPDLTMRILHPSDCAEGVTRASHSAATRRRASCLRTWCSSSVVFPENMGPVIRCRCPSLRLADGLASTEAAAACVGAASSNAGGVALQETRRLPLIRTPGVKAHGCAAGQGSSAATRASMHSAGRLLAAAGRLRAPSPNRETAMSGASEDKRGKIEKRTPKTERTKKKMAL